MADARLIQHRSAWRHKPALRAVYEDCYRRIAASCQPGASLEIGGGTGSFKAFAPEVVSTDIQSVPWLDAVCDAHALPFAAGSFDNIVGCDVLHHLQRPRLFLDEAARVLRPGGRLVLIEPAITPASWIAYNFFHPEPVRMDEDPLADGAPETSRDPFDANQAIPTLLFRRQRGRLARVCPELALCKLELFGLFAYPLSGGFRRWSLIPSWAVGGLLKIERALLPALGPLMAFRLFAVLERR